jgi:hypothetical protein
MQTSLERILGLAMAIVLVLLVVALSGCTDSDELVIPAAKSTLPFPATPDQLLANFHTAYASQDLASYAALLHPDFLFVRHGGDTYDRDTELRIAARMFSGEDYVKPDRVIAGIARIEFPVWEALGEWEAVPGQDPERLSRVYRVALRFVQTDGGVLAVRGNVRFQVVRAPVDDQDGAAREGWLILRQIDGT